MTMRAKTKMSQRTEDEARAVAPLGGAWWWGTSYGLLGLLYGNTVGNVQSLAAFGALVCSRFLVRDVWRRRTGMTRGRFAWSLAFAWLVVASALVALVRSRLLPGASPP